MSFGATERHNHTKPKYTALHTSSSSSTVPLTASLSCALQLQLRKENFKTFKASDWQYQLSQQDPKRCWGNSFGRSSSSSTIPLASDFSCACYMEMEGKLHHSSFHFFNGWTAAAALTTGERGGSGGSSCCFSQNWHFFTTFGMFGRVWISQSPVTVTLTASRINQAEPARAGDAIHGFMGETATKMTLGIMTI